MPLLKELASVFIEKEFGVFSAESFHRNFDPQDHANQALMRGKREKGWWSYESFK